jgi:hypothetical protein
MLGYHHEALEVEDEREKVKSFERNEKVQKIYRSHRDALTFSGEFISQPGDERMHQCRWLIVNCSWGQSSNG